jgi:cell division transport system permease protein
LILSQTYSALTEKVYESLAFLPLIPKSPFLTHISIVLLVVGAAIGALGSTISLRRFMKV